VYQRPTGSIAQSIIVADRVGGFAGWVVLLLLFVPDPGPGWVNVAVPLLLRCWPIGVVAGIRHQHLDRWGPCLAVAIASLFRAYLLVGLAWLATFLVMGLLRWLLMV
jgi:hypothetical protein